MQCTNSGGHDTSTCYSVDHLHTNGRAFCLKECTALWKQTVSTNKLCRALNMRIAPQCTSTREEVGTRASVADRAPDQNNFREMPKLAICRLKPTKTKRCLMHMGRESAPALARSTGQLNAYAADIQQQSRSTNEVCKPTTRPQTLRKACKTQSGRAYHHARDVPGD